MRTSIGAISVLLLLVLACKTSASDDCPNGQHDCNNVCVDVSEDPNNCGECGIACHFEAPNCHVGKCTLDDTSNSSSGGAGGDQSVKCDNNLTACSGECVDMSFDANNCGACGNFCPLQKNGQRSCQGGICLI